MSSQTSVPSRQTPPSAGKPLVLVLGAGSSTEVGLPVGVDLKQLIAKSLDIRFAKAYSQTSGDQVLFHSLQELARKKAANKEGERELLLGVSRRIAAAMPQAISIDNFIDSHRHDARIAQCGKLAITSCILQAEAASTLKVNENTLSKIDFSAVSSTWFNSFFQLLTENCQETDLPERLQAVTIVNFNYDRCFEHYLYLSLQNYYGMSGDSAAELLTILEVHHPYGMVGNLPWMRRLRGSIIPFGADASSLRLIELSQSLRTFTEGTDPMVSDVSQVRSAISSAQRLVFLGFAFHRLNLDVLFQAPSPSTTPTNLKTETYATAYKISESDCNHIRKELSDKAGGRINVVAMRSDLTCAKFFGEYWRSLSLS